MLNKFCVSSSKNNGKHCKPLKIQKFNKNLEFRYIYSHGAFVSGYNLTTYCLKLSGNEKKIGITASKKIGCAVKRNRARRLIFEAYRKIFCKLRGGVGLIFLARVKTCDSNCQEVLKSMVFQAKKLGIWKATL